MCHILPFPHPLSPFWHVWHRVWFVFAFLWVRASIYEQARMGGCTQGVHVRVPVAVGCVRRGHLVTPTMLRSLWSAVSVAVVVCHGDWMLAAQHFQPRQPTSEKEIWVAEMEGLLPCYFQSPLPVQHHPRYSIWELECVWCLWCVWVLERRSAAEWGRKCCACEKQVIFMRIFWFCICSYRLVCSGVEALEHLRPSWKSSYSINKKLLHFYTPIAACSSMRTVGLFYDLLQEIHWSFATN